MLGGASSNKLSVALVSLRALLLKEKARSFTTCICSLVTKNIFVFEVVHVNTQHKWFVLMWTSSIRTLHLSKSDTKFWQTNNETTEKRQNCGEFYLIMDGH